MEKLLKAKAAIEAAIAVFKGTEHSHELYIVTDLKHALKLINDRISILKSSLKMEEKPEPMVDVIANDRDGKQIKAHLESKSETEIKEIIHRWNTDFPESQIEDGLDKPQMVYALGIRLMALDRKLNTMDEARIKAQAALDTEQPFVKQERAILEAMNKDELLEVAKGWNDWNAKRPTPFPAIPLNLNKEELLEAFLAAGEPAATA